MPPGVGIFGSWFDEVPGYDEEEDSKTWEQPWSLPPPSSTSYFSPITPTYTPPPSKIEKERPKSGNAQSQPQTKAKPAAKQARSKTPEPVQNGPPETGKKKRESKAKSGQKRTKRQASTRRNSVTPPPSPSLAPVQSANAVQKPAVSIISKKKTDIFSLPLEVRDKIYSHLLLATTPITVMRGWTQCYSRYRGGLEPAILSVSRQTYNEGIRILYSANTFCYLIRDSGEPLIEALRPEGYVSPMAVSLEPPPLAELKTTNSKGGAASKRPKRPKPVAKKKSTVGDAHRIIYLAKYAHLLRRAEIVLESNRDAEQYRVAMAKAIQILGKGEGGLGASLTSLKFSLTPMEREIVRPGWGAATEWPVAGFFSSTRSSIAQNATRKGGGGGGAKKPQQKEENTYDVMEALRKLNVRLLHFTVYTPASRRLDMTLDMTYRNGGGSDDGKEKGQEEGLGRLLAHDDLVARQRQEAAAASSEAFRNLRGLILGACADTDAAVVGAGGWWTEYGPPEVAAVRSAMEGLDSMKEKMRRFRSPWYDQLRRDYAENNERPEHAACVRKVGRRLQTPAGE